MRNHVSAKCYNIVSLINSFVSPLPIWINSIRQMAFPCQGLPDRPCPKLRCDNTVHNTIYDLFLCYDCERMRDDTALTSASVCSINGDDDDGDASKVKTRKQSARTAAAAAAAAVGGGAPKHKKKVDADKDSIKSRRNQPTKQNVSGPATSGDSLADVGDLTASHREVDQFQNNVLDTTDEVHQLRAEVCRLTDVVNSLTTKLNFVLSFLQLSDDTAISAVAGSISAGNVQSNQNQPSGELPRSLLYSSALKATMPADFREAAVTAVYIDQKQRDNRKNSVIISGLPCSDSMSDKSAAVQLFRSELNVDAEITLCKRLGQQLSGRTQPLLVVLRTTELANTILSKAKCLRQSDDMLIRHQVFVNPHLTKAEARAAYEQRCRRRQRFQRSEASKPAAGATGLQHDVPDGVTASHLVPTSAPSSSPPDSDNIHDVFSAGFSSVAADSAAPAVSFSTASH